jgi:hypothetical protein
MAAQGPPRRTERLQIHAVRISIEKWKGGKKELQEIYKKILQAEPENKTTIKKSRAG